MPGTVLPWTEAHPCARLAISVDIDKLNASQADSGVEMDNEQSNLLAFAALDASEKRDLLRGFNQTLDRSSAKALLDIATDTSGDDDIRIEAVKILGLYHGEYDDAFIKEALVQIINQDAIEDDGLIVSCINTLALLTVNEKESAVI
ncbi:hypothetical protein [Kosakonia sp. S42]|uniref:hypothetical protein n=1 Tax=Kosakonia sp. S42 TaxID=2767458 RepID=UPI00190C4507|nr:hypothetical protein [Kosakonia sp. S42]MBK0017205.1 hypothetical protein [Kosakonia sp. S42]